MRSLPISAALLIALSSTAVAAYEPRAAERALYLPSGKAQATAYERGLALFEQKDFRGALDAFDEVLELQPEFAVARSQRGFTYLELGEFDRAIAEHDAVLRLAPNRPNSWANSCWARAVANVDLDEALKRCDRAVEMGGGQGAYDSRGFVHFRRGEFKAAVGDYSRAIGKDRTAGSPWFMRGVAKLRLGDATGRKDVERGLARDPDVQEAYARRGVQL